MRRFVMVLGSIALAGCSEPQFDRSQALTGARALACVGIDAPVSAQCRGRSVILSGFAIDGSGGSYLLSMENPRNGKDPGRADDFKIIFPKGVFRDLQGKLLVEGVVGQRLGVISSYPVVEVMKVEQAQLTGWEAEQLAKRQRADSKTPEQRVAEARAEGVRALEEWDAAIRKNNKEVRTELAKHAVAHHVRTSNDLRIDMYGMPDGRWIACTTKLYPQSAPITTCDGEP